MNLFLYYGSELNGFSPLLIIPWAYSHLFVSEFSLCQPCHTHSGVAWRGAGDQWGGDIGQPPDLFMVTDIFRKLIFKGNYGWGNGARGVQ